MEYKLRKQRRKQECACLSLGAWLLAMEADASAIRASMELCASKVLNHYLPVSSTYLRLVLAECNTTGQISSFLSCDAENRAHSMEWLAYSMLNAGDWQGSIASLRDLYVADSQSLLTPNHYLPFAYRAHARSVTEIFFWFPYTSEFLDKFQELKVLNAAPSIALLGENATGWYPIWAEAGYRFGKI